MNKIAEAYINEEFPLNLFETWDVVINLFSSIDEKTDEESQEQYDKLPSVVKVYRGVLAKDGLKWFEGVSWTTDRRVAEMFALRLKPTGGEPYIFEGEIDKENILYFTNARKESEVLINPNDMLWTDFEEVE
tara:strand:+ start:1657 stop:2052 length:396 start_codon:yes stop_codon:yes gene_type:complete